MTMRKMVFGVLPALVLACSGEIGVGDGARSWSLQADASGGLVDPRHPEFGAYPNPRAVDAMLVTLRRDGVLCATAGGQTWCGGVLTGIPYRAAARVDGDQACVSVIDLYGHRVTELCGAEASRIASDGPAEAGCVDATAADGRACRLCTDEAGDVTENTCPAPSSGDDSTIDEFAQDDCAGGDATILAGARLYVNAANDMFERAGLDVVLSAPTDVDTLTSFEDGDLELGSAGCEDVLDYLDDEFADDDHGEDWVFGAEAIEECQQEGSCRVGQIVTRAMAEACRNIPPGCNVRHMSTGIVGAGGETVQEICEEEDGDDAGADGALDSPKSALLQECVGSPLVLDLAGDGLSLQGPAAGARFALFGAARTAVGWIGAGDDALLAVDLDGDGAIGRGLELFGEAGGARDGFAALARHDDNGDGVIDPGDAIYAHLLAWRDDGDGVSTPAELVPLAATSVVALPVRGTPLGVVDVHGNELGLEAEGRLVGGAAVPVVDVWFRIGD